jgi:hypothetical protein
MSAPMLVEADPRRQCPATRHVPLSLGGHCLDIEPQAKASIGAVNIRLPPINFIEDFSFGGTVATDQIPDAVALQFKWVHPCL